MIQSSSEERVGMKVIENQRISGKESTSSTVDNVLSSLQLGRSRSQDVAAQETVIASLEKMLDNRYVILRDVVLEGLNVPIPLVLVGPTGLCILYSSPSRGVFQAKGEDWERMDNRKRVFKSVHPNLIRRSQHMAETVVGFLAARDYELSEVEPVLVFTDPGIYVEADHPKVRIVLIDGLERFTAGLAQGYAILDKKDVEKIVDLFMETMGLADQEESVSEHDIFSFSDEQVEQEPSLQDRIPRGDSVVSTLNRIQFTGWQWLLLGVMMIVNIIILIALVLLVLVSS